MAVNVEQLAFYEDEPTPGTNIEVVEEPIELGEAWQLYLDEKLSSIEDLDNCNMLLEEAGRPDLKIKKRAKLETALRINSNFAVGFHVPGITGDELEALINGDYPAIRGAEGQHLQRPSFERMRVLFPPFTKQVVKDMNTGNPRKTKYLFKSELAVASNLMGWLTDEDDIFVRNPDGTIDTLHLFH